MIKNGMTVGNWWLTNGRIDEDKARVFGSTFDITAFAVGAEN